MKMENPALLGDEYWQRFRFTGKELVKSNSLNMYDFGARWYDVAGVPMWTSVDPLCEKYYNVSPYAYCGNNPLNAIDPDGEKITYVNGSQSYIYSNGNFYINKGRQDGKGNWQITGSKVNVSPSATHMYRTLMALRKMDNSNNPTIKKVFDMVSDVNDGYEHKITKKGEINHATADDSRGSNIYLNYRLVDNYKSSVDFRDVGLTDYELLGHELKHSYNMEFYKTKKGKDPQSGIKMEEIETVNFENLIRTEEENPKRTKYGGNDIPKEYLEKGEVTTWN
jgi:RHS repeat-associated protein